MKRLRHRNQENESIASPSNPNLRLGGPTLIQPKQEEEFHPSQPILNERNKGKQPILSNVVSLNERGNQSQPKNKVVTPGRPIHEVRIKEANVDPGSVHLPKKKLPISNQLTLMKPKDEPFTGDMPLDEAPLAVIRPGTVTSSQ